MTGLIGKYVVKRIFNESAQNHFGTEDPYFETVPATKMSGEHNTGKVKKRKKALPPGLTPEEELVLVKVKRRAYRLDMSLFNCCGMRFGWSSMIALVPAVGDVMDAMLALMVVKTAMQVGLPNDVKAKMMMNIMVDFLIGLVPLLGDLGDVMFKANTRNAALLESYLREKGKKEMRKSGVPIGIDPSLPENFVEDEAPRPADPMTMQKSKKKGYFGRTGPSDEEARIESRQNSSAHAPQRPAQSAQPQVPQAPQHTRQQSGSINPSGSKQHKSSRR